MYQLRCSARAFTSAAGRAKPDVVVAMGVLPDRRRVELGTFYEMGEPRCFLRVRDLDGNWEQGDFMSVLPAYCTATDLTVNPETGTLHVLVARKDENGVR
jgi:hypothetical protein